MTLSSCAEHYLNPNWTVCAPALMAILDAAEQEGVSRQLLLREADLLEAQLDLADRWFPVSSYYKLYSLAAGLSGNPDIGLSVGRIMFLKGMNLQLYVCSVCKSFRDYLNLIPSTLKMRGDILEGFLKSVIGCLLTQHPVGVACLRDVQGRHP